MFAWFMAFSFRLPVGSFAVRDRIKGERRKKDPTIGRGFSYESIALKYQGLISIARGGTSCPHQR
jgi:hypothetical protein